MPKKRKKERKAPRKRALVRTAPSHDILEPLDWDDDPEDEDVVQPLDGLAERYPAPADAVETVRAGERVEWIGSIGGSTMRHRVVLSDDGTAAVEQAVFVGGILELVLLCAWHQAGEQGRGSFEIGVLAALDDLYAVVRPVLEAEIHEARPDYTAPALRSFREEPEIHGPGMPVLGWRILHPVGPDTTWTDTVDTAAWNSSLTMSGLLDYGDRVPELQSARFAQLLDHHNVQAVLCSHCGHPITNNHPRWTGTWVTPTAELGPLCEGSPVETAAPEPLLGMLTDQEFGAPHRPG